MGPFRNGLQLSGRRHPGDVRFHVLGVHHIFQGSHAHHVKFVQVGGRDAEEFQPLKQRQRLIPGLAEHPVVEFQPAQFPVDIIVRVRAKIQLLCGFLRHGGLLLPARFRRCLFHCRRFGRGFLRRLWFTWGFFLRLRLARGFFLRLRLARGFFLRLQFARGFFLRLSLAWGFFLRLRFIPGFLFRFRLIRGFLLRLRLSHGFPVHLPLYLGILLHVRGFRRSMFRSGFRKRLFPGGVHVFCLGSLGALRLFCVCHGLYPPLLP